MFYSVDNLETPEQFEARLLRDEVHRIVRHLGSEYRLGPVLFTEHGDFICIDCDENATQDGLYPSTGPVYCCHCGTPLDYYVSDVRDAHRCISWLVSLVKKDISMPKLNWPDLVRAIEALPLDDPHWRDVEYVVYQSTAVDPALLPA